jgi:hypothetical protein
MACSFFIFNSMGRSLCPHPRIIQTLTQSYRGQAYVIARHHQQSKYLLPIKIINKTLPTCIIYN